MCTASHATRRGTVSCLFNDAVCVIGNAWMERVCPVQPGGLRQSGQTGLVDWDSLARPAWWIETVWPVQPGGLRESGQTGLMDWDSLARPASHVFCWAMMVWLLAEVWTPRLRNMNPASCPFGRQVWYQILEDRKILENVLLQVKTWERSFVALRTLRVVRAVRTSTHKRSVWLP
jgi:hypothetical protein